MRLNRNLTDFPTPSKETWLNAVKKELKDKELTDLEWSTLNGTGKPFLHPEDRNSLQTEMGLDSLYQSSKPTNNWSIEVSLADSSELIEPAHEALQGVQRLVLSADHAQNWNAKHIQPVVIDAPQPTVAQNTIRV
ncbi:MAG: hypothetical protein KDC12_13890, partial [Flavobacteriales bacterium]|nr:hypothetical protein [Flavobacteriales bacterium]